MTTAYDTSLFDPPAPLARVIIQHPKNKQAVSSVPMLIDSGADVTLIPQVVVTHLNLPPITNLTFELMGFDGQTSEAHAVEVNLRFVNRTFKGRFLLTDQEWGIIGRDILNFVPLFLDGPNLVWREQPSFKQ